MLGLVGGSVCGGGCGTSADHKCMIGCAATGCGSSVFCSSSAQHPTRMSHSHKLAFEAAETQRIHYLILEAAQTHRVVAVFALLH